MNAVKMPTSITGPNDPVVVPKVIDKVDFEFEALLLEVLSDFQVTIPELGTVAAVRRPYVVLTSNNTRELSEALKRRCLYLHLDYPDVDRERQIVLSQVPDLDERLATQLVETVARLREQGAVLIGKTTTSEFGHKGATDNPLTGITRNPWNTATGPGGSSSGAAAVSSAGSISSSASLATSSSMPLRRSSWASSANRSRAWGE